MCVNHKDTTAKALFCQNLIIIVVSENVFAAEGKPIETRNKDNLLDFPRVIFQLYEIDILFLALAVF